MKLLPRWTFALKGARNPRVAPLHLAADAVLAAISYDKAGFYEGVLCCLDRQTGAERWRFTTPNILMAEPVVEDGRVYLAAFDGHLYCLDLATGAEWWKYDAGTNLGPRPALHDGRVVFCETHRGRRTHCLHQESGEVLWQFESGAHVASAPLIFGGRVYHGAADSRVYGLNLNTGRRQWTFEGPRYFSAAPARLHDHVLAGGLDGKLYLLHADSGQLLAQTATGASIYRRPLVQEAAVFLGNDGGSFRRYDFNPSSQTFTPGWLVQAAGPISADACLVGDVVCFGSDDQHLYAAHAASGELLLKKPFKSKVVSVLGTPEEVFVASPKGQVAAFTVG